MTHLLKQFVPAYIAVCLVISGCAVADDLTITPVSPADLSVTVEYRGDTQTLTFDGPDFYVVEGKKAVVPNNYASWYGPWEPWPRGRKNEPAAINLSPSHDVDGGRILGSLFRSFVADSIVITSEDGSKTFVQDEDYVFNPIWGQIASKNGKMGTMNEDHVLVSGKAAMQRIDLIQADGSGKLSVKKGKSDYVCPWIPTPDAGKKALAGIYIAPWQAKDNPHYGAIDNNQVKAAGDYAITEHEIFVIDPAPPVAPINKSGIAKTLKNLKAGKEVKIAFLGDSIMLGAEAGNWWADLWTEKNLAYPSKMIVALRKQYPNATVTPVPAFKGGSKTAYGLTIIEEVVLPAKPDLLVLGFGANDMSGAIGGSPNNPPAQFKKDMAALVELATKNNIEVILVSVMDCNPWLQYGPAERWPKYRQAIIEVAQEQNVACADVTSEWRNLATRGVPPFSQLHNWNNHPGIHGHTLFADFMMRFFE